MGELIGVGSGFQGGLSFTALAVSVAALGLFACLSSAQENDDDDSSPGGGLMQPVA
jgi:hypothetical protein